MTGIAESILALDPTAQVSINAEDVNQITWHDDNPNGITVEQITAKQTELQTAYDNDATAKVTNISSTKTKLEALGLTVDEIKDAFGI